MLIISLILVTLLVMVSKAYAEPGQTVPTNLGWLAPTHENDGEDFYVKTLNVFVEEGFDQEPDYSKLKFIWPIEGAKELLQRFGTPVTIHSDGKSKGESWSYKMVFLHGALDIVRSNLNVSDKVYAPVSGIATVIKDGSDDDYSTSLAIYHKSSKLVVSLMHLKVREIFSPGKFVEVKAGEHIGNLAEVTSMEERSRENFKHTHLSVVDLSKGTLLNPLQFTDEYEDEKKPVIKSVKLYRGGRESNFSGPGKYSVVIDTFDVDNFSDRSFEISSFSISITDQNGDNVFSVKNCNLDFLASPLQLGDVRNVFLLNEISKYHGGEFFDIRTNQMVKDKSFPYIVTNFSSGRQCLTVSGEQKDNLVIENGVEKLLIEVSISDYFGNRQSVEKQLSLGQ